MLWALTLWGCTSVDGPDAPPEPSVRFARPLEVYRELELITGTADFPAVASLNTLAGPGDSTLVLFGLSLPANVLRFQRDGTGFAASYVVSLRARTDSQTVALVDHRETVRVPDFAETGRTDESVVFQTALVLAPGQYVINVRVRDGLSARGFESDDTVAVPAYGPAGEALAPPLAVYRAALRTARAGDPDVVLNPRHLVPYGGGAPLVYVETYDPAPARLELRDARGEPVWGRDLVMEPGDGVWSTVVALPTDTLPMGRFWLLAMAGEATTRPVPFLVTLSDRWMASNFEQALDLLRYIATKKEVAALADANPEERRRLWEAFWAARDPVPATPVNEYRDEFFDRIRVATVQFSETGRPGWRTDRGEVYIVLGPPSRLMELRYDESFSTNPPRAQEWVYDRVPGGGGLRLLFRDRTGFGNYELTPESVVRFRGVADRMKTRTRP